MCKIEYDTSKEVLLARINKLENVIRSGNIKVNPAAQGEQAEEKQNSAAKKSEVSTNVKKQQFHVQENDVRADDNLGATVTINDVQKSWKDILEAFKSRRKMVIYASLVTGRPVACKNGVIDVNYEAEFAFNKIRLEKSDNAEVVNEVFSEILGQRVRVRYTTVKQKEAEGSEDIEQELKDKLGDGFQVYD